MEKLMKLEVLLSQMKWCSVSMRRAGNLSQYEIGKQGNKPRVMNVDSLRQFMEHLSSREQLN